MLSLVQIPFQHTFNCFSTASVFISKSRLRDSMPIRGVSERGKLSMGYPAKTLL